MEPARELVVFAASSLREVFVTLGAQFEREHPGAKVLFNFAGSQELRVQLEHGARADVMAGADLRHLDALFAQGLCEKPAVFARNQLALIVPLANPAGLHSLADLPKASRLVVGAREVPVGKYTEELLARAGLHVDAAIVSRELNVRQVLAKVMLGEADAGLVYRTDASAARGKVATVPIPDSQNVLADYPVALVRAAPHAALGRDFVQLLFSAAGRKALGEVGFTLP